MAEAFTKHRAGPDAARFFSTEAAGLQWLRVPGGPPLPDVLALTGTGATGSAGPGAPR